MQQGLNPRLQGENPAPKPLNHKDPYMLRASFFHSGELATPEFWLNLHHSRRPKQTFVKYASHIYEPGATKLSFFSTVTPKGAVSLTGCKMWSANPPSLPCTIPKGPRNPYLQAAQWSALYLFGSVQKPFVLESSKKFPVQIKFEPVRIFGVSLDWNLELSKYVQTPFELRTKALPQNSIRWKMRTKRLPSGPKNFCAGMLKKIFRTNKICTSLKFLNLFEPIFVLSKSLSKIYPLDRSKKLLCWNVYNYLKKLKKF